MPLNSKDSNAPKRPINKRQEKTNQPVLQKSPPIDNKVKQLEKPTERLNLNVDKKSNQLTPRKPNIDIVETTSRVKDNRQFSSRFKISAFRELQQLPLLKDTSVNERDNLLIEKIRQACVVFDFNDLTSDLKYKEIKKKNLLEIVDYFASSSGNFTESLYKELICMIGTNIFRALPPPILNGAADPDGDDEEPLLEPAWPHLQYVYEVFLRFLEHSDFSVSIAKQHIDHNFISYIMELFDSEDPRERDYLKTIVHRIYGKMINHRFFIRKQINYYFLRQIYEDESFRGTNEFLEILGSIINGFQIPLKDEHKLFLKRVLLPLHKVKSLGQFQPPLCYCITEFIKKDRNLLKVVVDNLLRFWPKTASLKEIIFLNELEEILELGTAESVKPVIKPVSIQLGRCISSQHFQVSERALYLWQNTHLQSLFIKNIDVILPNTFPALCAAKQHWNKNIHNLVYNAIKFMMDIDLKLFDECTAKFKEEKQKDLESLKRHRDWWGQVEIVAKKNPMYDKVSNNRYLAPIESVSGDDDVTMTTTLNNSTGAANNSNAHTNNSSSSLSSSSSSTNQQRKQNSSSNKTPSPISSSATSKKI